MADKVIIVEYKGDIHLGKYDTDAMSGIDLHNATRDKMLKLGMEPPEFYAFYYLVPGQSRVKHWINTDKDLFEGCFQAWNKEPEIVVSMVSTSTPNDLCKHATMLLRQQQLRVADEIDMSQENPLRNQYGDGQCDDELDEDARSFEVSPHREMQRVVFPNDYEAIMSMDDINGLIVSQQPSSQGNVGASRQKLPVTRNSDVNEGSAHEMPDTGGSPHVVTERNNNEVGKLTIEQICKDSPFDVPPVSLPESKGKDIVVYEGNGWGSDWASGSDDSSYEASSFEDYSTDTLVENEVYAGEILDYYVSDDDDDNDDSVDPNDKMYVGQLWQPDPDGTVQIKQWDMFLHKKQCCKVVRDYCAQEGKNMKKIKNAKDMYTIMFSE